MIKRQIPNMITLGNLLCGVLSILAITAYGSPRQAALLICLGIVFDFFDGLAARLLGVASPLGKELDSLADVVTSGVAPAFILYYFAPCGVSCDNSIWFDLLSYLVFLMPLFAAYRLAKFNLDTRQSHSFLGLPVPANALIWVGLALSTDNFYHFAEAYEYGTPVLILTSLFVVISLVIDVLMISEVPMFSLKFNFKDMSWRSNSVQYIFLIGCALLILFIRQWYVISLIILWYIIVSVFTQKKHAE